MSEKFEKNKQEGRKPQQGGAVKGRDIAAKPGNRSSAAKGRDTGAKFGNRSSAAGGSEGTAKFGNRSSAARGPEGTAKPGYKRGTALHGKTNGRPPFRKDKPPVRGDRAPARKEKPPVEGMESRRTALQVIRKVTEDNAYASLALDSALRGSGLCAADRRLATRLVYDTLDNLIRLDYVLNQVMAREDTDIKLKNILRLGACQLLLEDRIPESAATNTSVQLCTELGMEGL